MLIIAFFFLEKYLLEMTERKNSSTLQRNDERLTDSNG